MTAKREIGVLESRPFQVYKTYEHLHLIPLIYGKSYVGGRRHSSNLVKNLDRILNVLENVPASAAGERFVAKWKSMSVGSEVQLRRYAYLRCKVKVYSNVPPVVLTAAKIERNQHSFTEQYVVPEMEQ
jgi:hypothetical protein